mmetsp:Transcript_18703/g.71088  ORF Transcript_18703/g.71088 Transcript_18703/m.71088 type:complete len:216 (+) Transcript_18703:556-1203(+)
MARCASLTSPSAGVGSPSSQSRELHHPLTGASSAAALDAVSAAAAAKSCSTGAKSIGARLSAGFTIMALRPNTLVPRRRCLRYAALSASIMSDTARGNHPKVTLASALWSTMNSAARPTPDAHQAAPSLAMPGAAEPTAAPTARAKRTLPAKAPLMSGYEWPTRSSSGVRAMEMRGASTAPAPSMAPTAASEKAPLKMAGIAAACSAELNVLLNT